MKTILSKNKFVFYFLSFLLLIHIPFGFSKSSIWKNNKHSVVISSTIAALYLQLNLDSLGLNEDAYTNAMIGFDHLRQEGKLNNPDIISIVDFTKSSAEKRLFIIDVMSGRLLFNTYVAHGQNSGRAFAEKFSNKPSSLQSSLGFYETSNTYIGKNGYSLQLKGLEKGINDKADSRAIVIHGAPYVSEGLIRSQGYIGRSWGCPAIPERLTKPIIDKIKNGSCLFIYAQDKNYLNKTSLLKS